MLKTQLHACHLASGAHMVNFHGWELPLNYGSQLAEHHTVRTKAGMFDVSHMNIIDILGTGCRQFLRKLLSNDIDHMTHIGRALYSCMCNEHGGIIDELIVYQRAPDNYRLILNCATRKRALTWIYEKSIGFAVGLQERTDLAMLAVQGPDAIAKTLSILNPTQIDAISTLAHFESVDADEWFFAKTGYTGEAGLELIVPATKITSLWLKLLEAGVKPCGLAARDTLRLEAGMHLYGQDMDESHTPLESGLAHAVSLSSSARNFIGMGALLAQLRCGLTHKLVGLMLDVPGIMRAGTPVLIANTPVGIITSGTYAPTLNKSIAFARVPIETGAHVMVAIREKILQASVSKLAFIKYGKTI